MGRQLAHISATEGRTLCGLPCDGARLRHSPWPEWLIAYQADPSPACPSCKRIARQSADRFKAIRAADDIHRSQNPCYHLP